MNLLLLRRAEMDATTILLAPDDARALHIRKILKLGEGAAVRAGVVGAAIGSATILRADSAGVLLSFAPHADPPPLPPVELLLGHPRPIVLRRLLRDLTAIGPARIIVVPTELGEKSYADATLWDGYDSLLVEGAAQGGTTRLPTVLRPARLAAALDALVSPPESRIVLHPSDSGDAPPLAGALDERPRGPICVAVGSERGWTDAELGELGRAGFEPASLGERILRTETAATIAAWSAVAWYEAARG